MHEQFAQGDLLIEHVDDTQPSGTLAQRSGDVTVLAEGELTGHRHAIHDRLTIFRDEALAREIPADLYVGHLQIEAPFARVEHNEHDTITLTKGTYRVTRQREMGPKDAVLVYRLKSLVLPQELPTTGTFGPVVPTSSASIASRRSAR